MRMRSGGPERVARRARRQAGLAVALMVVVSLVACSACRSGGDSIGSATMDPDGTIVLQLRAEGSGAVGDAQLRYPPSHKDYKDVLSHLGGLEPGESKPVPPWP